MNALWDRMLEKLRQKKIPWGSFVFSFSMLIVFVLSFQHHKWRTESISLLGFSIYAWLIGYLLGKTRWSGFWCFLYSILMLLIVTSQRMGDIIPPLSGLSYGEWINQLNWQFSLYLDQIRGWIALLMLREELKDPNLFSIFLLVIIWMPVSWFTWVWHRKSIMWLSVFPMLVLIIQNCYAQQAPVFFIYAALFIILIFTAISEYKRKQNQWAEKHMDYPDSLWQDWLVAVFLISMISLVAAHYAPKVATPEGWQEIQEWIEEVREASDSESIVPGADGSSSGVGAYSPSTVVHIVSEPDVSQVGAAMPEQNQLVMWVRVADPTPRNWRTAVYTTYTGTGWVEAEYGNPMDSYADEELQQKLGFKYITQTFSLNGDYDGQLFAAGDPVQVNKSVVDMLPVFPDGSVILRGNVTRYEVVSRVPNIGEEHLRNSSGMIPQWIEETYLQLPESLPERVRALSHELVEGQETELDQVIAIQNYLRESVPYDLNTPMPAEGQEVVDYFLFEAPSGFCTYYATSMVVMLRELGIPARLVTGYASGRYILEQGLFQVWGTQAHAWVEVYFPEYGWIPFEPTPNREVPTYARSISNINLPLMMSQQTARRNLFWLRTGMVFLTLIIVAVLGFVISHLWRRRRKISKHSKHPYIRLYYRLRYRLQTFGYEILPEETAWEFWQKAGGSLQGYPKIHIALYLATQGVEKAIYSPYGTNSDDINALKIAIRNTWWEWVKMSWGLLNMQTTKFLSSIKSKRLSSI